MIRNGLNYQIRKDLFEFTQVIELLFIEIPRSEISGLKILLTVEVPGCLIGSDTPSEDFVSSTISSPP